MNQTKVKLSYPLRRAEIESGVEKYTTDRLHEWAVIRALAPPKVPFDIAKRKRYLDQEMIEAREDLEIPPAIRLQSSLDFWIEAEMQLPYDEFSILQYLTRMQVALLEGEPNKAWRMLADGDPHGFFSLTSMRFDSPFWLDVQIEPLTN